MQKGVVRRVITNVGGVVSDKTDEILISLRTLRIKILNTLLHANDHAEQEKKGKKKTNKNKRTSYGQTIIPCYCLHTYFFWFFNRNFIITWQRERFNITSTWTITTKVGNSCLSFIPTLRLILSVCMSFNLNIRLLNWFDDSISQSISPYF